MILFEKLKGVIGRIKKSIGEVSDLIPEEKKEVTKQLIKEAVIAYGRAMINEAMKSE